MWIGLDKYEKLIYGVQNLVHTMSDLGRQIPVKLQHVIIQCSVLSQKKVKVIKTVDCMSDPTITYYYRYSLSQCSEYVGIAHYAEYQRQGLPCRFYVVSLQTGLVQSYRSCIWPDFAYHSFDEETMTTYEYRKSTKGSLLKHLTSVGWICCVHMRRLDNNQTSLILYSIIFDDYDESFKEILLTDISTDDGSGTATNGRCFAILNLKYIQTYDTVAKSWTKTVLDDSNILNGSRGIVIASSKLDNVYFVQQFDVLVNCRHFKRISVYILRNNCWEILPIPLKIAHHPLLPSQSQVQEDLSAELGFFTSNMFILLSTGKLQLKFNIGVRSLQDLAMKQLFSVSDAVGLTEEHLVQLLNLPVFLKRKYFGVDVT